jgi:hypothetical protein
MPENGSSYGVLRHTGASRERRIPYGPGAAAPDRPYRLECPNDAFMSKHERRRLILGQ